MTRRERRYLRTLDRLELGGRAECYLRERPDVDGGVDGRRGYERGDGSRPTVGWDASGDATLDHAEVAERDDRVTIGVVALAYNAAMAGGRFADAEVELSRPLGDRRVIDATTGRAIPPRPRLPRGRRRPPRARRPRRRRA